MQNQRNHITAERAQEIMTDASATVMPWARLNDHGKSAICDWITCWAKKPEAQILESWFREAERAINDRGVGAPATIVLPARYSITGADQPLELNAETYDWTITAFV